MILEIPSLVFLDNEKVTKKDKNLSHRRSQLTEMIEKIAENEEICIRLEHLKSRLRVHRQLIISNFVVEYAGMDVEDFLRRVAFPQNRALAEEV